jgi:hypothetical protein
VLRGLVPGGTEAHDRLDLAERLTHTRRERQVVEQIGAIHDEQLHLTGFHAPDGVQHLSHWGGRIGFRSRSEQHGLADPTGNIVQQVHRGQRVRARLMGERRAPRQGQAPFGFGEFGCQRLQLGLIGS